MRKITRSVNVALKCLIAVVLVDVNLPYWTSKVEDLVAFVAIVSMNLWTSVVNLYTAVRFADPDFLLECKISAIWRRFPLIFAFYFLNVRHISTSGWLTYWPRKYTTRVDTHVDNSHQVWSWYDHPLPSYSVVVCWYVTWPGHLDLWPFDLEQLSYMAGYVTNHATKFEDPYDYSFMSYEL